jgi:hypothetical protein
VERATVRQRKTGQPVKFELTEQTREAIDKYVRTSGPKPGEFLFPSRRNRNRCITTRQYARLVSEWIGSIGLDANRFGTHSLRRTKASLIYRRTGSLRVVQLFLDHRKIESTVRSDDRRFVCPQSRYRGRQRVYCQTMRPPPPHLCTKIASKARKSFDHLCKKRLLQQYLPTTDLCLAAN